MTNTIAFMRRVAVLALVGLCATGTLAQSRLAIRAKHVITAPGQVVEGGVLLVENGKVKGVQALKEIPEGWTVVDRSNAVIAPGFVDVVSMASAPNDLDEEAAAIDTGARASRALAKHHRDFGLLRASGVTTVVVLPGNGNVVSGQAAVVKTDADMTMVAAAGPLSVNLGSAVHSRTELPTSFMGAVAMLRQTLEKAQMVGLDKGGPVTHFARGRLRGLCRAPTEKAARALIAMRDQFKFEAAIIGNVDALRDIALTGKGLDVILPAPTMVTSKRELVFPAELSRDGVHVAFRAETPTRSADALRMGAALAARHGLSAKAALAAITSVPARMAGADEKIGTLAAGRDADFVVLSGEPLSPASRVLETWIGGDRAHRAEGAGQ